MPTPPPAPDPIAAFIARWAASSLSERSNCQPFLAELCDVLDVPRPDPARADTEHNAYVFERAVPLHQRDGKTTVGRIDLYKRACFVLEAKQYAADAPEPDALALALESAPARKSGIARGSEAWDNAMLKARGQAERYARNLPAGEPTPPFLLVVDVGHVFELYADFSQQGKAYLPFPDARANRIRLADLRDPAVRAKLRTLWLDPFSLDPAKIAAVVTREVARCLAELAKHLEKKHDPAAVAAFLSRCLFCMFAEDVGLLPPGAFSQLLGSLRGDPGAAVPALEDLFGSMNEGRFYSRLMKKLLRFNGGLFAESRALPLDGTALGLLLDAAKKDWKHVEPAIFGTLLERALHPAERHKLGAHYTPRAYVERLVLPTVVEPLREEWSQVSAAAVTLANRGDLRAAIKETRAFHHRLCAVRVLDPACGSGNFLYVALEHLKRLEGEVLQLIEAFGENMRLDLGGETVDPHQFLGIELNPRAATLAELVLWIGYLQWHHRNRGATEWPEPVLRAFKNIECRDAVLAYDKKEFAQDAHGATRFVWNRKTTKVDSVTGRDVPDEKTVVPLDTFVNPRPAAWPQADFIVGNPPFLGTKRMRDDLGDGYVETLRSVYSDYVEDNADFVMYWWHKAAELTIDGKCRRFGFITTNSIRQTFNRRVVHHALMQGVSLRFAIPDHPWVDTADGAAVRIAMTVGSLSYKLPESSVVSEEPPPDPSALAGDLYLVKYEEPIEDGSSTIELNHLRGRIGSGLGIGAELEGMNKLAATEGVCGLGVALHGSGFILEPDEAKTIRKHGTKVIKSYLGGSDLLHQARERYLIDFSFMNEEEARRANPLAFERVLTHVKPERIVNRRAAIKKLWWRFGWERPEIRKALVGLPRFIATTETAKHRVFQFLDAAILADHMVIIVASSDAFHLGVLSSRVHVTYALAAGGTLEDRPRYNKTRCFDPFPFPDCTAKQKEKIRALAEELDAHRKRAQAQHGVGLTDIYNVLEKVRAGTALTAKEKLLHDQALVSTLRQLHDDLDAAVAAAYGWEDLTAALEEAEGGAITDFATGGVVQLDCTPEGFAQAMADFRRKFDAEILRRIVALNAARAAEEAQGIVRWLRPDYQKPLFAGASQSALGLDEPAARPAKKSGTAPKAKIPNRKSKIVWPKPLADRVRAVETVLAAEEKPATAEELAARFSRAPGPDILEILQTLVTLGRARPGDTPGTYVR